VVFAKGSHFPKGKPDNVCDYQELKELANEKEKQDIAPSIQEAWQTLSKQAEVAEHMNQPILYRPGDKRRLLSGCVIAGLAIAYTARYLGYI
jgi:hypothetical protein